MHLTPTEPMLQSRHANLLSLHSATCIFHYLGYDTEVMLQLHSSDLKPFFFDFQLLYQHTYSAPLKPTFLKRYETTVEFVFWSMSLLFLNTFLKILHIVLGSSPGGSRELKQRWCWRGKTYLFINKRLY